MGLSTVGVFKHVSVGNKMIEVKGELLVAQQHLLRGMLKDIDAACKGAGVNYVLSGGTCLGAIRHGGFIPWDDDMDLNIPHLQFPLFQQTLENMFPNKYTVQVPGVTPGYDLAFPRVRLNGTVVRSKEDIGKKRSECGLYVDVFYVESLPDNCILRKIHGIGSLILGLFYSCRRFAENSDEYLKLVDVDSAAAATFRKKIAIGRLLSFRSPEQWTAIWNRWNSICKDTNSKFIGIPVGRKHYFKETYHRSTFYPSAQATFEGLVVPVPSDVSTYMTALYGPDYMMPPSVDERETHVVYEFDLGVYGPS